MPSSRIALALPIAAALACSAGTPTPSSAPAPAPNPVPGAVATRPTPAPPLPPVPLVDGPLAIRVQYPAPNQQITSRDSNFMFGTIGSGRAGLTVNGVPARVYNNGAFMVFLANAPRYDLVASRGNDIARGILNVRLPAPATPVAALADASPNKPENQPTSRADTVAALTSRIDSLRTQLTQNEPIGLVQLGQSSPADSDVTIIGRPTVGGTYKWFFAPGTVVPLVAHEGRFARVRLDHELDVYVDTADIRPTTVTAAPRRTTSNMKVVGSAMGEDVIIPIGPRPPYFVEESDRSITITLYGVRGNTDIVNYASGDSLVKTVEWNQLTDDRARVTINLRSAPYGYLVLWENNAVVVKLRGRPAINAARPLQGLTIAVDPGHPPIGSTGPTGLYEATAVLAVGMRLQRMLEERGAHVVMTRTTDAPVALGDRPITARRANVHAFVSVHLNAFPDGVNPFTNNGTGTYFFRTHSEPLAREIQVGLVSQLGLRDLGINYDNLAVVRGTWYPAVLCEGAFVIMPDQEAALRTPEYQERYAKGIADGLENYFRSLGANRL
jgi:N-acetylmuramoyl-L-alanine amidase